MPQGHSSPLHWTVAPRAIRCARRCGAKAPSGRAARTGELAAATDAGHAATTHVASASPLAVHLTCPSVGWASEPTVGRFERLMLLRVAAAAAELSAFLRSRLCACHRCCRHTWMPDRAAAALSLTRPERSWPRRRTSPCSAESPADARRAVCVETTFARAATASAWSTPMSFLAGLDQRSEFSGSRQQVYAAE